MAAAPAGEGLPSVWLTPFNHKSPEDGRYQNKPFTRGAGAESGRQKKFWVHIRRKSEGANFWLSVPSDLQNRAVEDIPDSLRGRADRFPRQ